MGIALHIWHYCFSMTYLIHFHSILFSFLPEPFMSDTWHFIMQRRNDFVHSPVLKEQDHYSCTDCLVLQGPHSGHCLTEAGEDDHTILLWCLRSQRLANEQFLWLQSVEHVVETFTSVAEVRKVLCLVQMLLLGVQTGECCARLRGSEMLQLTDWWNTGWMAHGCLEEEESVCQLSLCQVL